MRRSDWAQFLLVLCAQLAFASADDESAAVNVALDFVPPPRPQRAPRALSEATMLANLKRAPSIAECANCDLRSSYCFGEWRLALFEDGFLPAILQMRVFSARKRQPHVSWIVVGRVVCGA